MSNQVIVVPYSAIEERLGSLEFMLKSIAAAMESKASGVPSDGKQPEYITEGEACEILKISRGTLYKMRKQGSIRYHRAGASIRYKLGELEAAFNTRRDSKK